MFILSFTFACVGQIYGVIFLLTFVFCLSFLWWFRRKLSSTTLHDKSSDDSAGSSTFSIFIGSLCFSLLMNEFAFFVFQMTMKAVMMSDYELTFRTDLQLYHMNIQFSIRFWSNLSGFQPSLFICGLAAPSGSCCVRSCWPSLWCGSFSPSSPFSSARRIFVCTGFSTLSTRSSSEVKSRDRISADLCRSNDISILIKIHSQICGVWSLVLRPSLCSLLHLPTSMMNRQACHIWLVTGIGAHLPLVWSSPWLYRFCSPPSCSGSADSPTLCSSRPPYRPFHRLHSSPQHLNGCRLNSYPPRHRLHFMNHLRGRQLSSTGKRLSVPSCLAFSICPVFCSAYVCRTPSLEVDSDFDLPHCIDFLSSVFIQFCLQSDFKR